MTSFLLYEQQWRGKAAHLAFRLDRARSAVEGLGESFEQDDPGEARRRYSALRDEVVSLAAEVKELRSEQRSTRDMDKTTEKGSTLVIRGCGAATIALDVMIDAMAALAVTDEAEIVDVLVGACIVAQRAYDDGAAVVKAASFAHGSSLNNLERAFYTEGEAALRKGVTEARDRVHEILARS